MREAGETPTYAVAESRRSPAGRRDGFRQRALDLAHRTGQAQIPESTVLAPESPWQLHNRQLGEQRLARRQRDRGRAAQELQQKIAIAPIVMEAAARRAEEAAAEVKASQEKAERHTLAAEQLAEVRANLPRFRHSHRFGLVEIILAAIAFIGADTLVLDLSLTQSPGGPIKHWLTAAFVAIGLLVYAHCAGWLWAVLIGPLPERRRSQIGLGALFIVLMLLPIPAFWFLQIFRHDGLSLLAASAGPDAPAIADPVFFFPVQAVLMAGAMLASSRWFLADDERRLRGEEKALRRHARRERSEADATRARMDAALRDANEAKRAGSAAKSDLAALEANAAAEDQVERENGVLLQAAHDTEYLLALEESRAARKRAEEARQEAQDAQDRADAARQEAREEAQAAQARTDAAREAALEAARRDAGKRDRLGLDDRRQLPLLVALAASMTGLLLVMLNVAVPTALAIAAAAGLIAAAGLLFRRSSLLTRHVLSLDPDAPWALRRTHERRAGSGVPASARPDRITPIAGTIAAVIAFLALAPIGMSFLLAVGAGVLAGLGAAVVSLQRRAARHATRPWAGDPEGRPATGSPQLANVALATTTNGHMPTTESNR